MLIPISRAFVVDFAILRTEMVLFAVISIIVILINQIMSKTFRKNNSTITDDTAQELIQDKNFNPSMISRVITFVVAFISSIVFVILMNDSIILHSMVFFFIGYVYFTMIQFKRL